MLRGSLFTFRRPCQRCMLMFKPIGRHDRYCIACTKSPAVKTLKLKFLNAVKAAKVK
jgi:hypothetical protein